jgi:protein-L-isoaspartate O-methyltransferase
MYNYKTIYKEVAVDISYFDTEYLVEELESGGSAVFEYGNGKEQLLAIYEKRRLGQDYQAELDKLIYTGLGKIL